MGVCWARVFDNGCLWVFVGQGCLRMGVWCLRMGVCWARVFENGCLLGKWV